MDIAFRCELRALASAVVRQAQSVAGITSYCCSAIRTQPWLSVGDCKSNYKAFHRLSRRSTLQKAHVERTRPLCGQSVP